MIDAVKNAVHTDAQSSQSGKILPHAYIVEEARLKLSGGTLHHLPAHQTKPEEFQSSACFDAWAKDDDAA